MNFKKNGKKNECVLEAQRKKIIILHPYYHPVGTAVNILVENLQLFATLWTVAHQAPLSKGFFRQEY